MHNPGAPWGLTLGEGPWILQQAHMVMRYATGIFTSLKSGCFLSPFYQIEKNENQYS